MNSSRRGFLAKVTALGVAGLVGGHQMDTVSNPDHAAGSSPQPLTAADFAPYLGQSFRLERDDSSSVVAQLIRIDTPRRSGAESTEFRQPFTLVFRLPGEEQLAHETYVLEHPRLGRLDIFLGSVGLPASEGRAEAIFA